MKVKIKIDARCVPKERPRVYHGHAITPKRTAEFEKMLRAQYARQSGYVFHDAVYVTALFVMRTPASWSRKRRSEAIQNHIQYLARPDIDNLQKAILDGLSGAWDDDKQCAGVVKLKVYGEQDEIRITLTDERDDGIWSIIRRQLMD